jgi:D-tyrosyl-tRNA(Tyr) deacylase
MRAVVQRVARAAVRVDEASVSEIGPGLLILLGVARGDTLAIADALAAKIAGLRIFEDKSGKMNLSATDIAGEALCISQFTLYADVRRGRRPSFEAAAPPDLARPLYEAFCDAIDRRGLRCARGVFGAHMVVELVNDGPVTLVVDSADLDRPRRA